jgi:hypothetical protein
MGEHSNNLIFTINVVLLTTFIVQSFIFHFLIKIWRVLYSKFWHNFRFAALLIPDTLTCRVLCYFILWTYTQSIGLLGRVIGPSQGLYLNTDQHEHRMNTHTPNINVRNRIRNHDHGVRASEDSSDFRPLGYRDRHQTCFQYLIL